MFALIGLKVILPENIPAEKILSKKAKQHNFFYYIMAHIPIFPEIVDPNQFTHLIHSFEQAYISMIQNEAEHRAVGQP